ncbi:MAG TPA: hypothetical protein VGO09_04695, partial [Flavisolibacter sp.]|nr:hypothetical protein [Flavisolibacter sp.]
MQKIYLLLRNNKQTGPYSLEELLEAKLKSYDLIWVEGRSAGWRYPTEIDSLKPFLPSEMVTQDVQIMPAGHIEKMPESIAQQVASPIAATLKSSARHIFVSLPSGIKQREVSVEP